MKISFIYLIVAAIVIVGIVIAKNRDLGFGSSECSQFSNKDGYRGCMSLTNGKEKKCKFKINNKINEATQQMEFTYACLRK